MIAVHQQFNDGSRYEISPEGDYDFVLPSGKHIRGKAQDVATAKQAVQAERERFIVAAWERGTFGPGPGQFVCPLR